MRYCVSFLLLCCFVLAGCHKPLYIQQSHTKVYNIENSSAGDIGIVHMLSSYKAGIDTQMQIVIGHADIPLTKAQPESSIGNFMADAQMTAAKRIDNKVVGSVINYGGIRLSYIPPGIITKGRIYELMPFDNMVTIIDVPGEVLGKFCSHMARSKGWPVSGITYTIKDKTAVDIKINGLPLNDNIVYKIALPDYIAKGGDNCDFFIPLKKKYTSLFVRDAVIDYIQQLEKQGKPLHAELENRIQYAE